MLTELQENGYVATILKAAGTNMEDFELRLKQMAQEQFIKSIRPSDEQVNTWKATENGILMLQDHIRSKTGRSVSLPTLESLWRLFTGRRYRRRNRRIVFEFREGRSSKVCEHCGETEGNFHVDHKVPLAIGGSDNEENFQMLCETCNLKKSSKVDKLTNFI